MEEFLLTNKKTSVNIDLRFPEHSPCSSFAVDNLKMTMSKSLSSHIIQVNESNSKSLDDYLFILWDTAAWLNRFWREQKSTQEGADEQHNKEVKKEKEKCDAKQRISYSAWLY